jgi:hypothetical protein
VPPSQKPRAKPPSSKMANFGILSSKTPKMKEEPQKERRELAVI